MSHSPHKLFALLIGINEYHPDNKGVTNLSGCANDVRAMEARLKQYFRQSEVHIKKLLDQEATRENIIQNFRSHLRDRADAQSVVLFYFSGHGSYRKTAEEFRKYTGDNRLQEETLVCYDSRIPGGSDLADKELAILLEELAATQAEIVLILDCCHSGSGAKEGVLVSELIRNAPVEITPRPIENYLDNYYGKQKEALGYVRVPEAAYALIAACKKNQLAREVSSPEPHGLLTQKILEVLDHHLEKHTKITYADLFAQVKTRIMQYTPDQTPQFESYEAFDAHRYFLEKTGPVQRRYPIQYDKNKSAWIVKQGSIHGLSPVMGESTCFAVYPENPSEDICAYAYTELVEIVQSSLKISSEMLDTQKTYWVKILNIPHDKLSVQIAGEEDLVNSFLAYLHKESSPYLNLETKPEIPTPYYVYLQKEKAGLFVNGFEKHSLATPQADSFGELVYTIEKIARWKIFQSIHHNPATIRYEDVGFEFQAGQSASVYIQEEAATVKCYVAEAQYFQEKSKAWYLPFSIKAHNYSDRSLYCTLLYFGPDYEIKSIFNEKIYKGVENVVLCENVIDPREENEITDTFRLLVSTVPLEAYDFEQSGLNSPQSGSTKNASASKPEDWFVKTISLTIIKELGRISPEKVLSLAGGRLTIAPHPHFSARVALRPAASDTLRIEKLDGILHDFREKHNQNLSLLNFAPRPSHSDLRMLELSAYSSLIQADDPLILLLDAPLEEDEHITPVTFSQNSLLILGKMNAYAQGKAEIVITQLPEEPNKEAENTDSTTCIYFIKSKEPL